MVVTCVRRCPGVDSIVEVSLVRSREGVLHAKNVSVADAPPDAKDVEVSIGHNALHNMSMDSSRLIDRPGPVSCKMPFAHSP